ncbi:hypothetical protein CkaCkLH20_06313 [Colletotrichum karsti]|uniref:RNase H type-1 domain-containing protein n=1 Tax=Colletotrichum karsti TaxID=1095194 RepID=A0A9P6ICY4_9PEZI|nr:uncharacterized protein CkaCkLH20_06313 [Colletotrichum karsti]KAF9876370.1 hypothetical protein CkaCkLH20_06313 [Colletotrichum karsti]
MAVVKQEEDEGSKLASIADPLANAPRAPRAMRDAAYARQNSQAGSGFGSMPTTSHREPTRRTSACAGVQKNKDRAGRVPEPGPMPMRTKEEDGAGGGLGQISTLNNGSATQMTYEVVDRTALVKKEEDAGENRLASKYTSQSVTVGAASSGTVVKVEAAQPASKLTLYAGGSPPARATDVSSRFSQIFGVTESRLEIVSPETRLTHLRYPYQENAAYGDSLVVAVKGVHPGYESGTRGTNRSAYGVFFGPECKMNKSGRIEDGTNTIRRAELYAAVAGAKAVRELLEKALEAAPAGVGHHGINHLVIKSSEEYVVKGIAGGDRGERPWIMNWEENGFLTAQGMGVQNRELWVRLVEEVRTLKRMGVTVQFWGVSEWRNQEASGLAEEHVRVARELAGFERFITPARQPSMNAVDRSRSELFDIFITPASQPCIDARGSRW